MPPDKPRRVLLIEDNAADVALIEEALREAGINLEMTVLNDGGKALDHLRHISAATAPDLIILDLNLPKHDGVEVLIQYRMNGSLFSAPIVVLTSSDSPSDRQRTKIIGISAYIRKPMDLAGFLAIGRQLKSVMETAYIYTGPIKQGASRGRT